MCRPGLRPCKAEPGRRDDYSQLKGLAGVRSTNLLIYFHDLLVIIRSLDGCSRYAGVYWLRQLVLDSRACFTSDAAVKGVSRHYVSFVHEQF